MNEFLTYFGWQKQKYCSEKMRNQTSLESDNPPQFYLTIRSIKIP